MYASKLYSWKFIVPAFLLFFVLFLVPNLMGFYYSLTNWNAMSDQVKFIGLDNFIEVFTDKSNFRFIYNTLMFAIVTSILKAVIGLGLALMLNEGVKSKNYLRTIFFMPVVISNLIVGLIFQQIYNPDTGILNGFLEAIGLGAFSQSWIGDPKLAIWSSMGVEIWKASGFNMVIFLAGLQMVPKDMYEAADMDGANYWNKLIKVTIPFLIPSITINMMLNVISGLKVFDVIFALTNGGPGRASEVINLTIFNQFGLGTYGYGTALGVILFLFLAVISIGLVKIFTRPEVSGR
ncbi:carbohydrate ABC transporter permease [Paenibacillus terrigena]|uniref:carbohydrate ABC transporter permease n=1 Tax=Paenibacillus terrigena TaxID=369333 RepID=UPI0003681AF1|nr:sugar ABC transporter permease [Paenibacillus terrigena]